MKHYGDITALSGYELPVVDVITGGSPCQDLSVAGKRAGLAGERSGLFMEQIRIVKEMRERDRAVGRTGRFVRPRYMVWENVPGAFSSNGGKDFQAVIEEICKIEQPDAAVPEPPNGKWSKSGCVVGDGFSLAWRVHDAQFWGVPQRRKRIALVADFGGLSAPEILFERKGVSGDSEPCGTAREETAGAAGGGVEGASGAMNPWDSQSARVYSADGVWHSLNANENGGQSRDSVFCLQGNGIDRADTIVTNSGTDVADTLDASYYKGTGSRNGKERTVLCIGNGQLNQMSMAEQANTLDTIHDQQAVMCIGNGQADIASHITEEMAQTLNCMHDQQAVMTASIVRRLTPLECERLQGFPSGWTDIGEWTDSKGKKHKEADSPRYKALGNSIALPFWFWLLRRISATYERPATLGSLFDGIGGFPLCWERCNGKGTAIWASEIEEFPIAVTKKHFPEEET